MKTFIRNIIRRAALQAFPEFRALFDFIPDIPNSVSVNSENSISDHAKLDKPCRMYQSAIGDYSYVAVGSRISQTTIGKFCSIGPNFLCGWGIHPINGISTSPTFYSATSYNGFSLAAATKIEERKPVSIGNDVFIGANVTILDGVTIADGAVIGAGAVVANDIPPYAIVAGVPGRVIRYRFDQDTIDELITIKWWDWNKDQLQSVEEHFFDVKKFTTEFKKG